MVHIIQTDARIAEKQIKSASDHIFSLQLNLTTQPFETRIM